MERLEYEPLEIEVAAFPVEDVVTESVVKDIPRDADSDMGDWFG